MFGLWVGFVLGRNTQENDRRGKRAVSKSFVLFFEATLKSCFFFKELTAMAFQF